MGQEAWYYMFCFNHLIVSLSLCRESFISTTMALSLCVQEKLRDGYSTCKSQWRCPYVKSWVCICHEFYVCVCHELYGCLCHESVCMFVDSCSLLFYISLYESHKFTSLLFYIHQTLLLSFCYSLFPFFKNTFFDHKYYSFFFWIIPLKNQKQFLSSQILFWKKSKTLSLITNMASSSHNNLRE